MPTSTFDPAPASAGQRRVHARRAPLFLISLDFELAWGTWDGTVDAAYRGNILGARQAVPALLDLFQRYQVRATWAAVGMLLFDSRKELLRYLPDTRPVYAGGIGPYRHLHEIGDDERSDPYHYALSLIRMILARDGMELGSHTFSHYYCLETGQTVRDFAADMESSVAAAERLDARPVSLVFPCNQYAAEHLDTCSALGFRAFRGNAAGRMHAAGATGIQRSGPRRAARLLDAYVDLSGVGGVSPCAEGRLVNLPSTRFLRPFCGSLRVLEPLRMKRIRNAMTAAAQAGSCFHMWWHPHNFGRNLGRNMRFLEDVLKHHLVLRERYGVMSVTMREAALTVSGGAL
ncbi:MAG TPA: polysaccharide deacetylase family protein [Bryobacteraceae bacterium]|nr:polysaccharide deacetylase family protein [Bryobacteraceae bacterium]